MRLMDSLAFPDCRNLMAAPIKPTTPTRVPIIQRGQSARKDPILVSILASGTSILPLNSKATESILASSSQQG